MSAKEKFHFISPILKKAYEEGKTINLEDLAKFIELDNKDIFHMESEGLVTAKSPYRPHSLTLFRVTKKGYLLAV